jgi:hypothetical protein
MLRNRISDGSNRSTMITSVRLTNVIKVFNVIKFPLYYVTNFSLLIFLNPFQT